MASLASPEELAAEGFSTAQFGLDKNDWQHFAQVLLDEVSLLVIERVGASVYASTDESTINRLKRAERFLAAAELWLRRMNRHDADVSLAGSASQSQGFTRFKTNHESYVKKAEAELAAIPAATPRFVESTSAPAFGSVNTAHFGSNG